MSISCPDCGSAWSKVDLANAACHSCGEILLPDDLDNLRKQLGVEEAKPPEIAVPIVDATPVALPNFEDCPNCQTPLMEADLGAWRSGSDCPYCGQASNHKSTLDSNQVAPEPQLELSSSPAIIDGTTPSSPSTLGRNVSLILNSGTKAGMVIEVPIGIIGRNQLAKAIGHPTYEQELQKISREHIEIVPLDDAVGIKDMGSRNGTYINNNRIVGTQPSELGYGSDLTLCGLSFSLASLDKGSLRITHIESGIRLDFPPDHTGVIHLGRMTEEGRREPWCRMAEASMKGNPDQDATILGYISRRHLYVKNELGVGIMARHEEGKDSVTQINDSSTAEAILSDSDYKKTTTEFEVTDNLSKIKLSLHKNNFQVNIM